MSEPSTDLIRPYPERRWCALHTKARHEKKVAGVCVGLRVPHYLPLRPHRTVSGGKVNTFLLPMFPGYVFAALAPGELLPLRQTGSVAQRIDAPDETGLLRDLGQVIAVERAGVELTTARVLRRGQRVMVTQGPLAGVCGTVLRQKNRTRLQVMIETIQQAILLDVERAALIPL